MEFQSMTVDNLSLRLTIALGVGLDCQNIDLSKSSSAQHGVYASCGGSVSMKFSFYISFKHLGQDAASKPQPS